jgi:cell division protein FtsB
MSKILFHPFVVFIISILCLTLWVSFYFNSREIRKSLVSLGTIQDQVHQRQTEIEGLQKKLEEAKKDQTQEAIIRNELLMQKPGEYIVQIPDVSFPSHTVSEEKSVQSAWEQWQEVLGLR